MTAYSSSNATSPVSPAASHGQAGTLQTAYALITVGAALTTADTFNFFNLPPNARVHNAILKCSDMDTGGPTLTLNVGDAGAAQRYFAASTAGGTGTVDATMAAAGRFFKTAAGAKTAIIGSVQANPTTGAAGTIELTIQYVVEDSATSP